MNVSRHCLSCVASASLLVSSARAATQGVCGVNERISVNSSEVGANGPSGIGARPDKDISADGRFVVFVSHATNLAAGDTNGRADAYLRDRELGTTIRVSLGAQGEEGIFDVEHVSISDDGRFVAFSSRSSNLVPNDTTIASDVFLRDTWLGTTVLVSQTPTGVSGNNESKWPSISADGTRVAFESRASDLVPGDGNNTQDIFVADLAADTIVLASVSSTGAQGTLASFTPDLSADGSHVVFGTNAFNFDINDPNNLADAYVRDLASSTTTRVIGQSGNFNAFIRNPKISGDGRYVVLSTLSTTGMPGGSNGESQIILGDMLAGTVQIVSRSTSGTLADDGCFEPSISADGQWVAFHSRSLNLVAPRGLNPEGVFVRNLVDGWTERASVRFDGNQLQFSSQSPVLSGDGHACIYRSVDPGAHGGLGGSGSQVILRDRGFGSGAIGTTYCSSAPNSTNQIAGLLATGSNLASDQMVTLSVESLPPFQFGFFLMSRGTDNVPAFGGSQGVLCLASTIYRLDNFIQNAGATGAVQLTIPFASLPGVVTPNAGDTWHFQYWTRDFEQGMQTSNTSGAVCVPFF